MTKIQIELPDATAQAAQAAGLLTPEALNRLLSGALRKQDAGNFLLSIAGQVATTNIEPLSLEEITTEIKIVRAERK